MKKSKKVVIIIFSVVISLLAVFFAYKYFGEELLGLFTDSNQKTNEKTTTDISELGYESITTNIIYNQLSDEEKELYTLISKKVMSISNTQNENGNYKIDSIVYNGTLSGYSIYKAVSAFIYENPDVFWLGNSYSYFTANDKTTLELFSYISRDECSAMSSEIIESINQFVSNLKTLKDEYEIEKAVFDYITSNCVYDTSISTGVDNWKAYTIYGALVDGKAVCEGYSKATLKLLNLCGVNSILINGYTSDRNAHMWNMININNNWYHLDVTSCDNDTIVTYKYFNLSDYQINKNFIVSAQYTDDKEEYNGNFALPKAFDESQNYYKKEGFVLSGFGIDYEKDLSIEIISAAQKNKSNIHLYIDKNLDFNQTVSRLFSEYPYFFSKCLKRAEEASRYTFDSENMQFVYDEITRGISVKFFEKND